MDIDLKFDHRKAKIDFWREKLNSAILSTGQFHNVDDIEKLSGGYSHFNYKFTSEKHQFVLRVSDKSEREFIAENSILKRLKNVVPAPRVTFAQLNNPILGKHISIQKYVPGILLSKAEESVSESEIVSIGYQLGHIMADIHSFEFNESGFLGSNMEVVEPFQSFEVGYFGYMDSFLKNPLLAERIGLELSEGLVEYVHKNDIIRKSLTQTKCLTHSDFNKKIYWFVNQKEVGRYLLFWIGSLPIQDVP